MLVLDFFSDSDVVFENFYINIILKSFRVKEKIFLNNLEYLKYNIEIKNMKTNYHNN